MKYRNKCVICQREATKKYRGRCFCDDCYKQTKRSGSTKGDKQDMVHVDKHYKLSYGVYMIWGYFLKLKK